MNISRNSLSFTTFLLNSSKNNILATSKHYISHEIVQLYLNHSIFVFRVSRQRFEGTINTNTIADEKNAAEVNEKCSRET